MNIARKFQRKARELLPKVQGEVGPKAEDLQKSLLKFIGDFANWDLSSDRTYLEVSRGLVKAAHPEETPLVVDPFAGGGSIPLEALRLGCETFASDLNPVACLILKVMLEDIPRNGPKLADELRRVGAEIKKQSEKKLADLYPKDPDGSTPIAYLWARSVRCESPDCGAEIPLVRSFWLCKKANRRRALRFQVKRQKEKGKSPEIKLEIFAPNSDREVRSGTVTHAKARCPACHRVLGPERVRAQLAAQRGGADVVFDQRCQRTAGARLLAVVLLKPGDPGRHYRLAMEHDYEGVLKSQGRVAKLLDEWERGGKQGLCPVPDEPTPTGGGSGAGRAFSVQKYGMMIWGDLFTARQKVALVMLVGAASIVRNGHDISQPLAISVSRFADIYNALCQWENTKHQVRHLFTRQAIPILWDFAEGSALGEQAGDHSTTLATIMRVVDEIQRSVLLPAQVQLATATEQTIPDASSGVWFTDPPYYDAVPYADLSDFFFVWLKRVLPLHPLLGDPFDSTNRLTPKQYEAVQDETKRDNGQVKDCAWFEETMAKAFAEGRRVLREDGIGSVVFAHKTTEGWEALLSGMIRGGWTITGSWPIATEMGSRLRARIRRPCHQRSPNLSPAAGRCTDR